ncbi:heterokaryon incompatibility protein-domain-containing protein [Massariosphaeria phaeospora]|uniref:Heterokaryon incompatibility protein-domain-containing protein n=1 Tax=Massariosphaeria phaeospora TaxID=100035 RepID=A0A7C8IAR5_9PLEO|nr:heterokaryon incompatibility protein-domain-containing protein [Massariosphaeria phaeospora]
MVSVCATCNGLQKHLRALDGGLQETDSASLRLVNTTLPSLRHSTNRGCRACALLLQGTLLHHERFAGIKEDGIKIKAESFDSSNPTSARNAQAHLSVEVRWKAHDGGCCEGDELEHEESYPDLKLEFFTDQDDQSPFSAIGRGRQMSENTLRDSGLSIARRMISDCLSSHFRCRQVKPTTLPKRVLDVLDDDSNGIRLHEAKFDQQEQRYEFGEYLTLSHCWGSGRGIPKTTRKTLESFKKSISWSSLPSTFQEAVVLTRSLGFRWLWIDSLCIVQDDDSDKLGESFNTDDIYGNSFLTIAATSAVDSSKGLFPPKSQPFKIQVTDSKGSLHKIYVREQPSHYSFKAPFDEGAHMNDWELPFNSTAEANLQTPLLKRAWAYTERLLSPRVLHFTQSEMILECKEGYQCECGRIDDPIFDARTTDSVKQDFARVIAESSNREEMDNGNGNGNGNGNDRRIDSVASQLAATSLSGASQDLVHTREDALQIWSYIITEFTERDLTYDADRLVALAAIARSLSPTMKSGYIAGQWTFSTLNLLWHPKEGAQCRRPRFAPEQNVPSWSWASIEGSPIFFDNATAMDLACTASFPAERGRKSVWSPISGVDLEITAALATEVNFRLEASNEYSLSKNNVSVEFRPDVSPLRGADTLQPGETLICVLVSMTFRSSLIGLVLKQSKNNAQVYRRVGRFECYECQRDGTDTEPDDAESLFEHWFPEVEDMTQLDDGPQRTFIVV